MQPGSHEATRTGSQIVRQPYSQAAKQPNMQRSNAAMQTHRQTDFLVYAFIKQAEAVFLVVCVPSMNELWAIYTGLCIYLYGSMLLTAHS